MEDSMELALRRQFEEALRQALGDPAKAAIARIALQMIIEGKTEAKVRAAVGEKFHPPKRDLAEERRAEIERFFRALGLDVAVTKPPASNRDFARWKKEGKALFFRPATSCLSYEAFMSSVGGGSGWTITDEARRAQIAWEPTPTGYWFLVDVAAECPRVGSSWNELNQLIGPRGLLSLEEYVIVYCTHHALTGTRINVRFWCWLRTRSGHGVLGAVDAGGIIGVSVFEAEVLSVSYERIGCYTVKAISLHGRRTA